MVSDTFSVAEVMLTSPGLHSLKLRRRNTSRPSSAWESCRPNSLSPSVLDARTATMTSSLPTSAKPSPFTTLATSWLGIGSLPTPMRRHCAMSVATRATNPTTTGRNGLTTRRSRLCSTDRRPPWAEMVNLAAQTKRATEFLPTWIH